MKKLGDDARIKGTIAGTRVSLAFLIALVIFGYPIQFSIILALVAGLSYGLLNTWWQGKDEPPPPVKRRDALWKPRRVNNLAEARKERRERKQQEQKRAALAKAKAEQAKKKQPPTPAVPTPQNSQDDPDVQSNDDDEQS